MSTWLNRTRFVMLLLIVSLTLTVLSIPRSVHAQAVNRATQTVDTFTLINARDDIEIATLYEDYVIDCQELGVLVLNVRANTTPNTVGSVRFGLDDNPNYRVENTNPYTLAGNHNGDYNGWKPVNGVHTITATPFTGKNATGTAGTALTIHIIAEQCVQPTATPTSTATQILPTATPSGTSTAMDTATSLPPTQTPTIELSITASSTETTIPATATPTSTHVATGEPVELIINGSFEVDSDNDKVPDDWGLKNGSRDKRKCNNPPKIVAYEGECAFQFKGLPGENSKLRQIMTAEQIAAFNLTSGDTLTLAGFIKAKGAVNGFVKVRVKYENNSPETGKITLTLNAPLADYTAFSALSNELAYQLAGIPRKVKLLMGNKGTSGKVRFDA
ncbi:MAG TPA: hypothetical protein VHL11_14185, partial [Phototrophicaceae bacterium]|nr:hypothetical protein [Phototrophicaceae bacterium]